MTKKQFNRLTDLSKRVVLAKDALIQLHLGKFIPRRGNYVVFPAYISSYGSGQDALKQFATCDVCAKGALICAYVQSFNCLTVGDMERAESNPVMVEIFGSVLWGAIESLFEGWGFDVNGVHHRHFENDHKMQFNQSHRRWTMEALLKNIIKNKGKLNYNGVIFG